METRFAGKGNAHRLHGVDALRGLAILIVIIGHAGLQADAMRAIGGMPPSGSLFHFALGTDLLLVIAGMFAVRTEADIARRLYRRATRILPLYWLMTLLTVVLAWPHGIPLERLMASLLFVPVMNGDGSFFPIVEPGWTMLYLVPFYLIAVAAMRRDADRAAIMLAAGIGVAVVFGLGADCHGVSLPPALHFLTRPILIDLAFGLMIGRWLRLRGAFPTVLRVHLLIAAVILYGAGHAVADIGGARALLLGLPAAMIVIAATGWRPGEWAGWLGDRIGRAGYSLYLTNLLFLQVAGTLWLLVLGARGIGAFVPMGLLAAILGGLLVHRTIDNPLGRVLRKSRLPQRKQLTLT